MTLSPVRAEGLRLEKKQICEIGSDDASQVAGFASGRLGILTGLLQLGQASEGSRFAIKRYQKIFMDLGGWGFAFCDSLWLLEPQKIPQRFDCGMVTKVLDSVSSLSDFPSALFPPAC